jgi:hypothetical protein
MHFTVLVVGTQLGWEEIDELLFPYFKYYEVLSQENMRADPRFVFDPVNIEDAFEEKKLLNPNNKEAFESYKNAEEWAACHQCLSYEKDLGWGNWCIPQGKDGKWDGYQIGGRYTGFFLLKEKTAGLLGSPGAFNKSSTDPRAADQARKCDIDWEAMRERGRQKAEQIWERAMQSTDPYLTKWDYGLYPRDTKESFIDREGLFAGTPFAVLNDGNWIEMVEEEWKHGVPSEKSMSQWHKKFQSLLEKIPDAAVLTLVDCHC